MREKQGMVFILAAIVPHGIFEIPSFILSGALGFLLANALSDEWHGTGDASANGRALRPEFHMYVHPPS